MICLKKSDARIEIEKKK